MKAHNANFEKMAFIQVVGDVNEASVNGENHHLTPNHL